MGLKFGLWFEPEMVSKNTKLLNEHPDWLIETPNRPLSHGRNQYILDFSREEEVDHIYTLMSNILKDSQISYIKWDMNRYITEPFSRALASDQQGELFHRYILGVYSLYERLIEGKETFHYGDELMNIGIILGENFTGRSSEYWSRPKPGDFSSRLFLLKEIK